VMAVPSAHPTDHFSAPPSISSSPSISSHPTTFDYSFERNILIKLFESTNGNEWLNNINWNTSVPICNWFGISCIESNTVIESLQLQNNNMDGTLPSEIASLNVSQILLDNNKLHGEIPKEMWSMEILKGLSLSQNSLTGTLSSEIWLLADSLNYLWVNENNISGSIPTEIGSLNSLQWLWLDNNNLTGAVPSEIGLLTSLRSLRLHGNNFSAGPIPEEVCGLRGDDVSTLEWLWADCGKNDCRCCTQCCVDGAKCAPPST